MSIDPSGLQNDGNYQPPTRHRGSGWQPAVILIVISMIASGVAIGIAGHNPRTYDSSSFSTGTTPPTDDFTPPTDDFTTPTTDPFGTTNDFGAEDDVNPAASWTLTATDSQGYSATVTISVDSPVPVSEATSTLLGRDVESCPVDPNTDAVIPVHIQATNTTAGFSSYLQFSLTPSGLSSMHVAGDAIFSDGPTCEDPQSGSTSEVYGVQWDDSVTQNETENANFYLVVYGYYSPAEPSGDVGDLSGVQLTPGLTFGQSTDPDAQIASLSLVDDSGTAPFTLSTS